MVTVGKWEVEEPTVYPGIVGDKGLVVKSKAAHHAISVPFPKILDNTDNTLVVQYEVRGLRSTISTDAQRLRLTRAGQAAKGTRMRWSVPQAPEGVADWHPGRGYGVLRLYAADF